MVAVAYGRWSFTRGSSIRLWLRTFLVFWEGGRLWAAVARGGSTVYWADPRWHKKKQFFLILFLIDSNQFTCITYCLQCKIMLKTFHGVLWTNQNLVAEQKFKLFKTRPITVSTQASFMEINFAYKNKMCFSTEGYNLVYRAIPHETMKFWIF